MLENDLLVTLFSDSPLTNARDIKRLKKGLHHSKQRMLLALLELADSVRSLLKTGVYVHPCPSFIASDDYGRPLFLGHAFSLIVDENLALRVDFAPWIAAHLICILGACKKMTPCKKQGPKLADEVVSQFLYNQARSGAHVERTLSFLDYDTNFSRSLLWHYNRYVSLFASGTALRPAPAFGPGANFERLDPSERDDWLPPVPSKLNIDRTFAEFYYSSASWKPKSFKTLFKDSVRLPMSRKREMVFHAVPKSVKSYRGVGKTRAWLMGAQLSLQRAFYTYLPPEMPLKDQSLMGNIPKHVGTIDLSAASDTLQWCVLLHCIEDEHLRAILDSVRVKTVIIDGEKHDVHAPMMGEGITFPLMSAWFCAICMAVCDLKGWGHNDIRVYGDDIQTPHFETTCFYLEALGHRINSAKSYHPTSLFKESCEYHNVSDSEGLGRADARPRFVPSAPYRWFRTPRLINVVDVLRIQEWLFDYIRSGRGSTNSFRHFFPANIPDTNDPTELGYPTLDSVVPKRYKVILQSKSHRTSRSRSLRSAVAGSLRKGETSIFEYHAERSALLKRLRREICRLKVIDTFDVYDAMFRESPLFRFHTLIHVDSTLLDSTIFYRFGNNAPALVSLK